MKLIGDAVVQFCLDHQKYFVFEMFFFGKPRGKACDVLVVIFFWDVPMVKFSTINNSRGLEEMYKPRICVHYNRENAPPHKELIQAIKFNRHSATSTIFMGQPWFWAFVGYTCLNC